MKLKNIRNKKGNVVVEFILLFPVWFVVILLILVELEYTKTSLEAIDELKIAMNYTVVNAESLVEARAMTEEILEGYKHGDKNGKQYSLVVKCKIYYFNELGGGFYKDESDPDLDAFYKNGNVLEITTFKYSSFYNPNFLTINFGGGSYTPSRFKVEESFRMVISNENIISRGVEK